jgi:hypothetical protein
MLLFDTSPEPKKTKRAARAEQAASEPDNPIYISPPEKMGAYDDFQCADDACQGAPHDILDDVRGQWLLECCFCGTKQWAAAVAGHLKPRQAAFRFRDGRFAGLTIDDVIIEPRGADYLKWAAESHPRTMVREAVKTWLASRSAPV